MCVAVCCNRLDRQSLVQGRKRRSARLPARAFFCGHWVNEHVVPRTKFRRRELLVKAPPHLRPCRCHLHVGWMASGEGGSFGGGGLGARQDGLEEGSFGRLLLCTLRRIHEVVRPAKRLLRRARFCRHASERMSSRTLQSVHREGQGQACERAPNVGAAVSASACCKPVEASKLPTTAVGCCWAHCRSPSQKSLDQPKYSCGEPDAASEQQKREQASVF